MSESLALSKLVRKLKESKEREIEQVRKIEEEKLSELSQRLSERLSKELNTIEEGIRLSAIPIQVASEEITEETEKSLERAKQSVQEKDAEIMQEIKKLHRKRMADMRQLVHREIEDMKELEASMMSAKRRVNQAMIKAIPFMMLSIPFLIAVVYMAILFFTPHPVISINQNEMVMEEDGTAWIPLKKIETQDVELKIIKNKGGKS